MPIPGVLTSPIGGAAQPRVSIGDEIIVDVTVAPTNASAGYSLTSAGVINEITVSGGTVSLGNWITPTVFAGAAYEVRATEVSGTVSTGTVGSWLALSSTRTWTRARVVAGSDSVVLTIEIRLAASGAVLDSATVTLTAEKV